MSEQELKPCPCGETPEQLCIESGQIDKWAWVSGDCCSEWSTEFRTNYHQLNSDECYDLAIEAWNRAKRADHIPDTSKMMCNNKVVTHYCTDH